MAKAVNNINAQKATAAGTAAEKKKAVIAIGLLVLMATLWLKNIMKKNAIQEAQALSLAQQSRDVPKEAKFSYIALPQDKDRHSSLRRDIFAANMWKGFRREGQSWADGFSGGDNQGSDGIEQVVKNIEFGAVVAGTKGRRAFIEGNMLSAGAEFTFKYKHQSYEFRVLKIYDDKVELQYDEAVLIKKIEQPWFEDN
ncbi:MAG: hypothetical protein GWO86_01210 [Planctomycetes bacterium]|nr:hypothetical protein [Planctomycetota bacterium]